MSLLDRVHESIKKYESKRIPINLSIQKDKVDYLLLAKSIILNFKMYEDGFELSISDYDKVIEELTNIQRSITDVERRLKALPRYFKKFKNYPPYELTEDLRKKVFSLYEEVHADLENDNNSKTKNTKPIALIEGSMKVWRRLGRRQRPKKLRRESELYKFLRDIFDAFSFNEDVEYWYNKWANIRNK